ncbi:MAG: PAC2 family protein [Candidatus Anstonellales archaeon]
MEKLVKKRGFKANGGTMIVGLPGIGLVGHVCARYMISEMKMKLIARYYSSSLPQQVIMLPNGLMRPVRLEFHYASWNGKTVVVMSGDSQAISNAGQYKLAEKVVRFAKELGIKEIITIGGYSTGQYHEIRRVFGSANSSKVVERFKKIGVLFGEAQGSILGAAGLIPSLARFSRIEAICLMGETHGNYIDDQAAINVLKVIIKATGMPISLKKLEEEAVEKEKLIKRIEEELNSTKQVGGEDTSYIR